MMVWVKKIKTMLVQKWLWHYDNVNNNNFVLGCVEVVLSQCLYNENYN